MKKYDPLQQIKHAQRISHFKNGGTLEQWIRKSKIFKDKRFKNKHKKRVENEECS